MNIKITKNEMDLVVATGKMLDLGLYAEEIAEVLEEPVEKVLKWVWFHKMNEALKEGF